MFHACPLYPQKRTLELSRAMSALCQKRTSPCATIWWGVVAAMNSTDTPHRHRRSRKEAACEGNRAALYDDAPDAG